MTPVKTPKKLIEVAPPLDDLSERRGAPDFWSSVAEMRADPAFQPIDWTPEEIDAWRDRDCQLHAEAIDRILERRQRAPRLSAEDLRAVREDGRP